MSLRPPVRHWLLPCLGYAAALVVVGAIAFSFPAPVRHAGNWKYADPRPLITAIVASIAFIATRRLVRGRQLPRRALLLAHDTIAPRTDGYRAMAPLTVEDLLARLRGLGYRPTIAACADDGAIRGPVDAVIPLAGAHVEIRDSRLVGHLRLQLPAPELAPGQRRLSQLEIVAEPSSAMEEMGLFALRELDAMLGGVQVTPTDSALSAVEARTFTAGLAERPALA